VRIQHSGLVIVAAALLGWSATANAEETSSAIESRVAGAITRAWLADEPTQATSLTTRLETTVEQVVEQRGRAARTPAGPDIGMVGLGFIAGLSDLEIGPSFRLWINDRFGLQAHLGFSGDDIGPDSVDFIRFEPTFIVAIGDFGDAAVNVRPYVGGGLRVVRADIGQFNDSDIKPVGVGGVEFGFRGAPRFKVSAEASIAPNIDIDDFDPPRRGPRLTGARVAALGHYFF
jgi:hypothetical protein